MDFRGAAVNAVMKELGFPNIEPDDDGFKPIFLFTDDDGRHITRIIGDENYR